MITEIQDMRDGRHAKRNKLTHVVTINPGDYEGRHRLTEYGHIPQGERFMGCQSCVAELKR